MKKIFRQSTNNYKMFILQRCLWLGGRGLFRVSK